jgi:hypothetical protein
LICFLALATGGGGCNTKVTPKVPPSRYQTLGLKTVPPYLKDTIFERTDVTNTNALPVNSYGLVVNLRHSGDSKAPPPVRDFIIKEMYRHGIDSPRMPGYENITPEAILADPRTAIVMVGGYIPAGARRGQRVDVFVQALPGSNTASLAGGQLWRCDLRVRGVDPLNPSGSVIKYIEADGPLFINPALALEVPGPGEGGARTAARVGTVIGGGRVAIDRPIHLRSRTPTWPVSRSIEYVVNTRFGEKCAAAQDEGVLHLNVPLHYKGNWDHFVGVVNHLFINITPANAARKAQELVQEAQKPGALLENISYALEGLGPVAVSYLTPLLATSAPDVQYAAARAGAFLGDRASEDTLMKIAVTNGHPFRVNAILALGELPNNSVINQALARCLDAGEAQVRIEAYKILADNNDPNVFSYTVNNTYIVDEVRSNNGRPLIYASRTGRPRLAIFGNRPMCNLPMTFSAFDHQLTIASDPRHKNVLSIFYRGPELQQPVSTASGPTVVELAARLGGAGTEGGRGLRFGYGEVVAMLQSLVDSGKVSAAFVMQDLPRVGEDFEDFTAGSGREVADAGPTQQGQGRPVGQPADGPPSNENANAAPAKPGVGAPQGRSN